MPKCDYGCGREGKYYSKWYKTWRCEKNPAQCPAVRKKLSEANKGKTLSEEHRKKLSKALNGEKNPNFGKRKEQTSMFGRKHSEETRKKMSEAQKGRIVSEETKRKLSESLKGQTPWNKGKKLSEEHKRKLSEAQKARFADKTNHPMFGKPGPNLGKSFSKEHRKKISEANKGIKNWNWKGGVRISIDRRVFLHLHGHPMADKRGYIARSRFIMSELLGRPLMPKEIVHHINGKERDDFPQNLKMFPSRGKHMSFHVKGYAKQEQELIKEIGAPCCLLIQKKRKEVR